MINKANAVMQGIYTYNSYYYYYDYYRFTAIIQNVLAGTFSQELYDFVGAVLLLACPSWW